MKTKSKQKLSVKLALSVAVPTMVLLFLCWVFASNSTQKSFNEMHQETLEAKSVAIANSIDTYFAQYKGQLMSMGADPNFNALFTDIGDKNVQSAESIKRFDSYEDASDMLDAIVSTNPSMIDCAYIIETDKTYLIYNGDGVEFFPQVLDRQYYLKSKEKMDIVMCDPYISSVGGATVVPMAAPVYQDGSMVGLVALDFKLNELTNSLNKFSHGNDHIHFMVISENGDIIYSSNDVGAKNIFDSSYSSDLLTAIENRQLGAINYENDNGEISYGSISSVGDWNWFVVANIDEADFISAGKTFSGKLAILFFVCSIIISVICICLGGQLIKPIKYFANAVQDISDGRLDVEVDIDRNDEFGDLADALRSVVVQVNRYDAYINELSTSLKEISNGNFDFELKVEYRGDFIKIKDSLLEVKDMFKHLLGYLENSAVELQGSSASISDISNSLAASTSQQSISIGDIIANVETVNTEVKNTYKSIKDVEENIRGVKEGAQSTSEFMTNLTQAMNEMNDATKKIGEITKTIENIAFQTNILAINASVEAARAGSAGKGFAVVANEVKTLANNSKNAAQNTAELLDYCKETIIRGIEIAERAASATYETTSNIEDINEQVNELSEAANRQAKAMADAANSLDEVSHVIENTAGTAQASAASSEELSSKAQQFNEFVQQFGKK